MGLVAVFVDSAFGHTPDGRPLFMPFGVVGRKYLIGSHQAVLGLRRQVMAFLIPVSITFLSMASLFLLPEQVRNSHQVEIIGVAVGSFVVFSGLYSSWVWYVSRKLQRLDEDVPFSLVWADPQELAARELQTYLTSARAGVRGTSEALMAAGALAGFACQMAVRFTSSLTQQPAGLIELALEDGRLLYFGDALNAPLAEASPSVWSIISEDAPIAELEEIFSETATRLPSEEGERLYAEPISLLQRHWRPASSIFQSHGLKPDLWHLAIARAARELAHANASENPSAAAMAIMRAAVPMSKVDPAQILVPEGPILSRARG